MSGSSKNNTVRYATLWGIVFLFFGCLYLLHSVLLPFVVGIAAAYFLNPPVDRLVQACKMPRGFATTIVLSVFLLVLLPLLVFLCSIAVVQVGEFVVNLPQYISSFGQKIVALLQRLRDYFPVLASTDLNALWQDNWAESLKPAIAIVRKVVSNGFAFVNVLSLLLISPVVAFYMLRDWPEFTGKIYDLVPQKYRQAAKDGITAINRIISGYLRGQLTVCVALGVFYSCGLWLVGLHLGVLIGFLAGVISFIPYVGSVSGFLMAMVLVVTQYGTAAKILEVIAVFAIGQFIEGNFLTPKLVGENIGLHPVWVMFALLAGGSLLGLFGMIVAVPVAAIIGVLLKYLIVRYKKSAIYLEK